MDPVPYYAKVMRSSHYNVPTNNFVIKISTRLLIAMKKIIAGTLFTRTTDMYCNKYLHLFVVKYLQDSSARNLVLILNKVIQGFIFPDLIEYL
jgi:hypothetical protein